MSTFKSNNKKKVSFLEVGGTKKPNVNIKKGSILKSKHKIQEEEKVIQPIEKKNNENKIEIKKEEPIVTKNKNKNRLKNLPTDEYFKLTIQDVLQQGLLNIAMIHPTDPIRFLGNFLIEKSKQTSVL